MPNPYDDILREDEEHRPKPTPAPVRQAPGPPASAPAKKEPLELEPVDLNDPRFHNDGPEPLDEILEDVEAFNKRAEAFSRLLSELAVTDHKVSGLVTRLFIDPENSHDRGTLAGERAYHELQERKFRLIIAPMRELGELHLATVKQFNQDIDQHYYSVEKTDRTVASEKSQAVDGINLQRTILADATDSLQTLRDGLIDTEKRIRKYINAGGDNNISRAEFDLLVRKREQLTSGQEHVFDYGFFDVNLLDKTALSLGIYLKETSAQYLGKLGTALAS